MLASNDLSATSFHPVSAGTLSWGLLGHGGICKNWTGNVDATMKTFSIGHRRLEIPALEYYGLFCEISVPSIRHHVPVVLLLFLSSSPFTFLMWPYHLPRRHVHFNTRTDRHRPTDTSYAWLSVTKARVSWLWLQPWSSSLSVSVTTSP